MQQKVRVGVTRRDYEPVLTSLEVFLDPTFLRPVLGADTSATQGRPDAASLKWSDRSGGATGGSPAPAAPEEAAAAARSQALPPGPVIGESAETTPEGEHPALWGVGLALKSRSAGGVPGFGPGT
jgi:hypothetical protein